ncbi:heparan sulfate glucosamine 3-O-sulfotransferase 5-like [Saccoglossus kowalevskii]|uniref:Heparan sulfate glucosamine 3-O-sulfotransferase 5-like n=1 Tax=Saccoglossus kowalevskii TaxID=10224 RepID=A0ABM0MK19_SACKO|nr:PREDICTED: heparan sulfate glucosamine 3-O-sulfotransferase 5-like [Saccoglossus kowalevskii]
MAAADMMKAFVCAYVVCVLLVESTSALAFDELEFLEHKYEEISTDAGYDIDSYVKAKFSKSCYEAKPGDLTERFLRGTADLQERKCEQRLPQAIIIGVRKCYSGRLLQFLRFHPTIEMRSDLVPLDLFSGAYDQDLELYRKQMPFTTERQMTIEKTPEYFIVPHDVPKIVHDNIDSNMKIIAVVCDPVRRAIADYVRVKSGSNPSYEGMIGNTFEETVMEAEREGHVNHLNALIDSSLYFKHFLRWLHYFPQENIYLLDSKLLTVDPTRELKRLEAFLGLPPYFQSSHFAFDEELGRYCIVYPQRVCLQGAAKKTPERPKVAGDTLKTLYEFFAPYDNSLSNTFGQKLSWSDKYGPAPQKK